MPSPSSRRAATWVPAELTAGNPVDASSNSPCPFARTTTCGEAASVGLDAAALDEAAEGAAAEEAAVVALDAVPPGEATGAADGTVGVSALGVWLGGALLSLPHPNERTSETRAIR
jgi:hypothetical protein